MKKVSAKDIKSFLKENGIDTKDIRISTANSINVKLLDPKLDYDKIESLLSEKYESYQRDDATGEILSGGNTFVFLEYDSSTIKEVSEQLEGTIKPFLKTCTGIWSIPALVNHYVDTQPLEYNKRVVKRAIQESLYVFLKSNVEDLERLKIEGWN